jgi:hypothetical protein
LRQPALPRSHQDGSRVRAWEWPGHDLRCTGPRASHMLLTEATPVTLCSLGQNPDMLSSFTVPQSTLPWVASWGVPFSSHFCNGNSAFLFQPHLSVKLHKWGHGAHQSHTFSQAHVDKHRSQLSSQLATILSHECTCDQSAPDGYLVCS